MNARGLSFCFMLALAPAVAHAQDDADTKAARARFQEGVDAFDKGNFESARSSFKQAYALKHHPAVLLNLAQSSLKSGHYLEAAGFFSDYLKDPQGDKKDDARKGLTDARSKLGRLEVSAPSGSEVTIDTNDVGKAPLTEPVDVEAGNHTVHARLPDGSNTEQKVVVTGGQVLPVRFAAAAVVVVPTNPPPTNIENPTNPPPTNPPPTNPPPTNPPTNPPPQTQGGEKVHPIGGLVMAVAGGALVVGGAVIAGIFAAEKGSASDNLDKVQGNINNQAKMDGISSQGLCNNPPSKYVAACNALVSNINSVNQDATAANVGVGIAIVGAALAAGGVIWYILGAKTKEGTAAPAAPATSFNPWIGPGLVGGSFRLTF